MTRAERLGENESHATVEAVGDHPAQVDYAQGILGVAGRGGVCSREVLPSVLECRFPELEAAAANRCSGVCASAERREQRETGQDERGAGVSDALGDDATGRSANGPRASGRRSRRRFRRCGLVGCDREQGLLLPPSLRDWLPAAHLVWCVLDAVEQIDLSAFHGEYRETGGSGRARPGDDGRTASVPVSDR
jgi:hypothetical protein